MAIKHWSVDPFPHTTKGEKSVTTFKSNQTSTVTIQIKHCNHNILTFLIYCLVKLKVK